MASFRTLSVLWVFSLSHQESQGIARQSKELELSIVSTVRTTSFWGSFEQHLKWALAKEDSHKILSSELRVKSEVLRGPLGSAVSWGLQGTLPLAVECHILRILLEHWFLSGSPLKLKAKCCVM